jgi:hypothetical protein
MANGVNEDAVRAAVGEVDEFESLGGGGQGRVWRVRRGNEIDAVKVLLEVDPERADREVKALQAVNSPHVMKFRGTLTVVDGARTLAAIRGEFIPGGTVATRLEADEWPSELRYAAVTQWRDSLIVHNTTCTDIDEARAAAQGLAEERG